MIIPKQSNNHLYLRCIAVSWYLFWRQTPHTEKEYIMSNRHLETLIDLHLELTEAYEEHVFQDNFCESVLVSAQLEAVEYAITLIDNQESV